VSRGNRAHGQPNWRTRRVRREDRAIFAALPADAYAEDGEPFGLVYSTSSDEPEPTLGELEP
jgi:hypothetical protein